MYRDMIRINLQDCDAPSTRMCGDYRQALAALFRKRSANP